MSYPISKGIDKIIRAGEFIFISWESMDIENVNIFLSKGNTLNLLLNKSTKNGPNSVSIFVDDLFLTNTYEPCKIVMKMQNSSDILFETEQFYVLQGPTTNINEIGVVNTNISQNSQTSNILNSIKATQSL